MPRAAYGLWHMVCSPSGHTPYAIRDDRDGAGKRVSAPVTGHRFPRGGSSRSVRIGYGGTLVWYLAIARIDLTRATAIVVPSVPLLSLVVSFLLLGEVATRTQVVGLALTAVGILAFVTDGKR